MSEWTEHLDELRRRIIAVLIVLCAASAVAFVFAEQAAGFLLAPVAGLGVRLYTFNPAEKFTAYLHLAVWTGIVCTVPFALTQIGLFVWPALRRKERRLTLTALIACPLLFLTGAALSYRFLSPVVITFFLNFGAADGIAPLWGFKEYLALLYTLLITAGLFLQAPLVLLLAFALGIVSPAAVARLRPSIILLIFLVSALCTPPDIISQIALGIPLYLIFELTLLIGRFLKKR